MKTKRMQPNRFELHSILVDNFKASGEDEEPGIESTRRPRVPVGIAQPSNKRRYWWEPRPQKALSELDASFGARFTSKASQARLLCYGEVPSASDVEDAFIAKIDGVPEDIELDLPMPRRLDVRIVRAA